MSTAIEWTQETWNPTVGCSRVSPGCDGCYAIGVAHRAMQPAHEGLTIKRPGERTDWTGEVRCLPERLEVPLRRRKPTTYFVDSMSDLFHPDVPLYFINFVWKTMRQCPQHTFQILTKRPQRMAEKLAGTEHCVAGNVWLGTSIESDRYAFRADHLRVTPAAVRFLSLEPLLGPLPALDLTGIDWVIVGGESGPGARPMHPDWVRDIRDRCVAACVPFFFKQWGAWAPGPSGLRPRGQTWTHRVEKDGTFSPRPTDAAVVAVVDRALADGRPIPDSGWHGMSLLGKKAAGRMLDGRTWDEMPKGAMRG